MTDRYRKKPVEVRAWKIGFDGQEPDWVREAFDGERIDWCPAGEGLYINTLEGRMKANVGDMLIEGVKGELYGCRADIFAATYEPVETTIAAPSFPAQAATEQQARWRPEVVAFADAMERKLRANDWKGGWKDFAPGALMDRVREEFGEAQRAYLAYPRDTDEYRQNLLDESADVANMLMMVCDVVGAIATPLQEPQTPAQGAEVSPLYAEGVCGVLKGVAQICKDLDDEALAKEERHEQ